MSATRRSTASAAVPQCSSACCAYAPAAQVGVWGVSAAACRLLQRFGPCSQPSRLYVWWCSHPSRLGLRESLALLTPVRCITAALSLCESAHESSLLARAGGEARLNPRPNPCRPACALQRHRHRARQRRRPGRTHTVLLWQGGLVSPSASTRPAPPLQCTAGTVSPDCIYPKLPPY